MKVRRVPGGGARVDLRDHPNLKDVAAGLIRERIVSGAFPPGIKVDQEDIARVLGISRLPVREALIELAQKGFVVAVARRGAFVVDLSVEDVEDHFEVLGMVFALAARRAAKELTAAQLAELRGIHEELAAAPGDPVAQEALNREFNQAINDVGCSPRLRAILRFLEGALPAHIYFASSAWEQTEARYREQMLRALEARDADAAARVAREHLRECARVTVDEMHRRGYWCRHGEDDARRARHGTRRTALEEATP